MLVALSSTGGPFDYLQPLRQRKPGPLQVLSRLRQRAGEPAAAAAPAPSAAGLGSDGPIETARTVLPPAPLRHAGGDGSAGQLGRAAQHGRCRAPKPKGGIPWNDSPKMPAPWRRFSCRRTRWRTSAGAPRVAERQSASGDHARAREADRPRPAPRRRVARSPAPTAARPFSSGFAFCGACGTRIARQPSGAAAALGVSRARCSWRARTAPAPAAAPRGRLILIRPDGTEGGVAPAPRRREPDRPRPGTAVRRRRLPVAAPRRVLGRPERRRSSATCSSLNGVFLKITGEEPLESGDIFRIGQELLRFEVISPPQPLEDGTEIMGTPNPGFWGRLSVIVGPRRRRLGLPAVRRRDHARPRARRHPLPRGRLRLGHARAHLAARRARVPHGPRLVERHVPAPAQRAGDPHRLVHADGPAALPASSSASSAAGYLVGFARPSTTSCRLRSCRGACCWPPKKARRADSPAAGST